MKFLRSKAIATLGLLLLVTSVSAADPAAVDLLSRGQMNDAIRLLVTRDDAESLHLLSRAYYAIEDWDSAVRAGERAVESAA